MNQPIEYLRDDRRLPPIPGVQQDGAPSQDRVCVPRFFMQAFQRVDGTWFDREMVEILIAGDTKTAPIHMATDTHRNRWPAQYEAFKRGIEIAVQQGTPLAQWPVLAGKPSVIRTLEFHHIHTVETFADIPDTALRNIGPGALELREMARSFVELKEGSDPTVRLEKENQQLRSELDMMKEQIREMQSRVDAEPAEERPRRGRPPGSRRRIGIEEREGAEKSDAQTEETSA